MSSMKKINLALKAMPIIIMFMLNISVFSNLAFAQKKSYDTSKVRELKLSLERWRECDYCELTSESVYDSLMPFNSATQKLKQEFNTAQTQHRNFVKALKEVRKDQETVNAIDLAVEFIKNRFKAQNTYEGRRLNIQGVVVSINQTVNNQKYVVLSPNIQFFFNEKEELFLELLSLGEYVIIRGDFAEYLENGGQRVVRIKNSSRGVKSNYNKLLEEEWVDTQIFLDKYLSLTYKTLGIRDTLTLRHSANWDGVYKCEYGILKIKNSTGKSFKYELNVDMSGGIGEISGNAKVLSTGKAVHYLKDGDQTGQMQFVRERNRVEITESGCTFFYHGAGATFNGAYYSDK